MRESDLPSPAIGGKGHHLRRISANAISQCEISATGYASGKCPSATTLSAFFASCAVAALALAGSGAYYVGLVANRTFMPNVATTNRYIQSTTRHILRDIPSDSKVQLVYPAGFIDVTNAGVETPSTSTRTFTAGVSLDPTFATGVVPVTFSGTNSGSQPAGVLLVSDPVQLPAGSAIGAPIYVRQWADRGATAGTHPYLTQTSIIDSANGEACNVASTAIVDVTKGGGAVTNSHPNVWFGPAAIIGATTKKTCAITGDSRGFGAQAGNSSGGGLSPIQRALDVAGIAWACLSVSSDNLMWAAANAQPNRIALTGYASHVPTMFGTNDLTTGARTAAQFIADADAFKAKLAVGKVFKLGTIGVFSVTATGSDYTQTSTQSIAGGAITTNAVRVTANRLIRARSDFFENADYIETARESGVWRVTGGAWTAEGTHESSIAANNIAAQPAYAAGILA